MEEKETVKERVKPISVLTPKVIILLLIWTIGGVWFFLIDRSYATIWNEGGQIPPFIIILLAALPAVWGGRKLGLNAAEIATLFSASVFLYGHRHILNGIPMDNGVTWAGWIANTLPAAIRDPNLGPVVSKLAPWYMFPVENREELANILYRGLTPGESFPIGAFVIPALHWTVFTVLVTLVCSFLVFAVIGRSWVEVERLAFPHAVAASYALSLLETSQEAPRKKIALFDWGLRRTRIFWWGFIIGILIGTIPILSEFVPGLAAIYLGSWGFAVFRVEPLAALIPGAYSLGVPQYPEMFLLFMLLSNETIWSVLILWVVFGIIYQAVVVATGAAPYTPGDEFAWNWSLSSFGNKFPFPYTWIAMSGMSIGAGLCLLWNSRGRIRELYEILVNKRKDEIDQGLSMKRTTQMGLISMLLLIIFLSAGGVPVHIAIVVLVFYILYYLMMSRVWAEFWIHQADWAGVINYVTFPLGVSTGMWPSSGGNFANFATQMYTLGSGWSSWTVRCGAGMMSPGLINYYAIARRTNANLKHILYAVIMVSAIGFFTAYLANLWLWAHGGGTSRMFALSGAGSLIGKGVVEGDVVWHPAAPSPEWGYIWFGVGALITIATYILRMRFPLIPFNPYLYNPILGCLPWYWPNALIAIILKTILVRLLGLRRFVEVFTPFAAGCIIGSGILAFPKYIHHLVTVSWPTLMSYYVP